MATSSKTLMTLAVAAVTMSAALACVAGGPGLFTDAVDYGCAEPFECHVSFCECLGGSMTASCTPFNSSVTAAQLQECAAARVTCVLNAALNARNVWNSSCQRWGDHLAEQYSAYYNDRTNTNLTEACKADLCGVVTAGSSTLADEVNYTYVCSFVNFSWPAPVPPGEVAGCVASNATYFAESMPMGECGTAPCIQAYCTCVGGTWNATALTTRDRDPCSWPATQPATATWKTCLATGMGCLAKAALDNYVPRASPLNPDHCIAWSVPVARDYAAYVTATNKETTELFKACNQTACDQITRFTKLSASDACTFAALNGRASTYQPYDPCPYSCPDSTCAFDLADCACTANAVVSTPSASFSLNVAADVDMTKALTANGFAAYAVSSGNCSSFDFGVSLQYLWKVTKADGTVVLTTNSSTLVIPGSTLAADVTYTLNLTVRGLRPNHVSSKIWTFKAVAPAPTVSITQFGATLRVSNQKFFTIKAKVVDVLSGGSYSWSCVDLASNTCGLDLSNSTNATLIIPSGAAAGEYQITYTYRGQYNSTLNVTIVTDEIPYVRVVPANVPLTTSPQFVYLYDQTILLASVVQFSGNVTYSWTVGGVVKSTTPVLALAAKDLTTTSVANLGSSLNENVIVLTVTSTNSSAYGLSSFVVVVIEDYTFGLTVTNGVATSAVGLTDTLTLATTSSPSLTTATAPFGASLSYSFEYSDLVSGTSVSVGLHAKPSGAQYTATAPLFSDASATVQNTTFRVVARLNGIVAGAATATFNLTKPDIAAATAAQAAKLSSITNPADAVEAAAAIRALMAQNTGNTSANKELGKNAVTMLAKTVSDASTLSPSEQASVFAMIGSALVANAGSATDKKALSDEIKGVVLSALRGNNFDSSNADVLLETISSMDSSNGGSLSVNLAQVLSNDPNQPIAVVKTISKPGYTVVVVRQTGGALKGFSVPTSTPGVSAVTLPSSFSLADLSADEVVGVSNVVLTSNPYDTTTPNGKIAVLDITKNGQAMSVSGQSEYIEIFVEGTAGTCAYFNTATNRWTSEGLRTRAATNGFFCGSKHLTAFGTFTTSSAATVALSMLVVLLAALVQLVLA